MLDMSDLIPTHSIMKTSSSQPTDGRRGECHSTCRPSRHNLPTMRFSRTHALIYINAMHLGFRAAEISSAPCNCFWARSYKCARPDLQRLRLALLGKVWRAEACARQLRFVGCHSAPICSGPSVLGLERLGIRQTIFLEMVHGWRPKARDHLGKHREATRLSRMDRRPRNAQSAVSRVG